VTQARRLVGAVGADLGAVFDRAAERLYLVDELANEVRLDQALLLFLRLLGSTGRSGTVALPVNVTSQADEVTAGGLEVVRTATSFASLSKASARPGVVFAGGVDGGYVFPEFLPAYDGVAALCMLLELLAPLEQPLSALIAELPRPTLVHRQLECPWALKGTVMRVLNERFADADVDLTDGIKVTDDRGWTLALPDPDEPLIHLYAEGATDAASAELEDELRSIVSDVIAGEEIALPQGT
jgi:mannose-1-phosphate guanylyltransferase/phosphomannomutase